MSNIYHTEPITSGKVVLHTTYGDVDIELWPKEAPLACRNFIQLSLEGYYDNTIVHRVIKNFMVQMGDPTGTGLGGESIWGKPFKDEIHGRIKFNHRGQVAMANASKPNSNQSQFFITLDSCDSLHGKHTIFGKVTGSTFYNVMRMGEVETEGHDRPVNQIRITSVEVLVNPFDDIIPRVIAKEVQAAPQEKKKGKEITAVAVKNSKLLSFGDDDEEEDTKIQFKMKSLHETKKRKRDNVTDVQKEEDSSSKVNDNSKVADTIERDENDDERTKPISRKIQSTNPVQTIEKDEDDDILLDEEAIARAMKRAKKEEGLKSKGNEFMQLREELLRSRRAVSVLTGTEAAEEQKKTAFEQMLTPLEQRRQKYLQRKAMSGDREERTLNKLDEFKKGLISVKSTELKQSTKQSESYHGQVLEANSDEEDDDMKSWCAGKLKFKRHVDDQYRQGSDKFRVEEYEVVDTRKQRIKTHQ